MLVAALFDAFISCGPDKSTDSNIKKKNIQAARLLRRSLNRFFSFSFPDYMVAQSLEYI